MLIINHPAGGLRGLPTVSLRTERNILAKRRWRGTADDGTEFGFDLEFPLHHGALFYQNASNDYLIEQMPEEVLQIPILSSTQAAKVAWQIGNLHFPAAVSENYILAEKDSAILQMLAREKIPYSIIVALFQPFHQTAGHSHHHGPHSHAH